MSFIRLRCPPIRQVISDDHASLVVQVEHHLENQDPEALAAGSSNLDQVDHLKWKAIFPVANIIPACDFALHICGDLDGKAVASDVMRNSGVVAELIDFLHSNRQHLGIRDVNLGLSRDRELIVYLPTLSSSISTGSPATSLRLKRILLKYSISRTAAREEAIPHVPHDALHAFSSLLPLPYRNALDIFHLQFARMHLIRRYPKIFSNFATILQAERPYCDAIGRYVKQIYQNSQERDFQKLCRKSIKKIACAMEENHRTRVRSLSSALQLAPTADDLRSPPRPVNPVDICMDTVLADALENLFSFSYKVAPQAIKSISASGSSTKCSDISQPDLVDLISASHITATPPDTCLVHFMEIESDSGSLTSIYELDQDLDLPCPNSPQEQMLVSPTLRSPAFSDWSDVLSSGTQLSHEDDVGFNARPSLLSADDPPLCSPPRAADDMDAWNIFIDPEDVLIVDDILAL